MFFVAFVVLMGVAWLFANPQGYAPDEPAHYTKAVGVGRGQWVGRPGVYPVGPGFGPQQLQWINKAARVMDMPPRMAPENFACSLFNPRLSAACLKTPLTNEKRAPFLTYVGSYEPYLYLPPGLATTLAGDAATALLFGRIAIALISLSLIAAAAKVLMHPGAGAASLLGLIVAVTPMVVFLATELAPLGPEISAAICCTAVVLRLARREAVPRWVWAVAGLSGAVLAMSRSLGPFFLAGILGLFLIAVGPSEARRALVRGGLWAVGAGVLAVVGVAANVAWGLAVQPHPSPTMRSVLSFVGPSVREMPEVLRQMIGSFGWQDVNMPRAAYVAWAVLTGGLLLVALTVGRLRHRLLLLATIAGCFVGTVALAAAVIHQTHFPMYGRYALPMWVTVPLVAGEIVVLNRERLPTSALSRLALAVCVVAAGVHATAWYVNARRYAVSDYGPVLWLGEEQWSPRGGWLPWLVLAALATAALLLHATRPLRRDLKRGRRRQDDGQRAVAVRSRRSAVVGSAP